MGAGRTVALVLLAGLSAPLVAQADAPLRPYSISWGVDAPVILLSGSIAGGTQLVLSSGELQLDAPLDESSVLGMDRFVLDAYDPDVAGAAKVRSDVLLYTSVSFVLIGPILTWIQDDAQEALVDLTLYSEAVAVTLAVTNLVKTAVQRPRPIQVLDPVAGDTDRYVSFYSGHTATVATLGACATTIAFQRKRPAWQRWLTFGVATVATTWVGLERVIAHKHYPSDVLVGALVGTATGILVPTLHRLAGP